MILVMKSAINNHTVPEHERDAYIEKGWEYMLSHPEEDVYYIQTGDMVILFAREGNCLEVSDLRILRSAGKVIK